MSLVSMIAFVTLNNTKKTQDNFLILSEITLPSLNSLENMKEAANQLTTTATEITIIKQETTKNPQRINMDERIKSKLDEFEGSRQLFESSVSRYNSILKENYPNQTDEVHKIVQKWNNLVIVSNNLINAKIDEKNSILDTREEMSLIHKDLVETIDSSILATTASIESRKEGIESLVNETTTTVLITLNLFIATAIGVRLLIVKSISKPLTELSKVAHQIAKGNFTKLKIKEDDEISEVGNNINKMSEDLEKFHKTIVHNEKLSVIGSLSSRIAHDLRNPLSVIKNSINILKLRLEPIMDHKTSDLLTRVDRAIDRMSHQIDDVLDYVSISALHLKKCSLEDIIKSAYLNSNVPESINVNLPDGKQTINCDPYKLEVAFSNIINNAVQALGNRGQINIRTRETNNENIIEFEDSGPGISENSLDKIFEPLFTTKQTGTGLGLASCKNIIEKHNGAITVRNNPTTFTIIIPKRSVKENKIVATKND